MEFLQVEDQKQFAKIVKEHEKIKVNKQIPELIMASGQAKVQMSNNSAVFCSKMNDYIDSY